MNRFYNVTLDVAPYIESHQGLQRELAGASVVIESDDEELIKDLIAAIQVVETLREGRNQ